ncbi:MAG: flagellar basal-body MS-ring/collar protein FliF [Balneolales bacterium]
MGRFTESVRSFFEPLSSAQRMIFGLLVVVLLSFLVSLFYWTLKPDFTLLFGSLNPESVREIVEDLEGRGVKYRVEDDGRSIYVHSDKVHEMRMQLASVKLVHAEVQGYELFDANALGMTDFMQRINKKRALEGELSRTIGSLEQVEYARVHLVLPERSPFQETSVEASASIILNLNRGQKLSNNQVEGMTHLVAGSVEGLDIQSITVLDQNGNRLTDGMAADGSFNSGGSHQMKLRQSTENYLTERGQSMLDRVLGHGNSILRVAAEHDFDRIVRESDMVDPDSRIIISEERRSESVNDESFQHIPFDEFTPMNMRGETVLTTSRDNQSTTQTRNYEVNKVREMFEKPQGEIKRISASVLLNYKQSMQPGEDGENTLVAEPYTAQELEELQEVIRTALGIRPDRGDEITITQIQFYDPTFDEQYRQLMDQPVPWTHILRWILILAALSAFVALIYNLSKRLREEQTPILFREFDERNDLDFRGNSYNESGESGAGEFGGEEDIYNRKLSDVARKQIEAKSFTMDEIKSFVEKQPDDAASVARAMMMATPKES